MPYYEEIFSSPISVDLDENQISYLLGLLEEQEDETARTITGSILGTLDAIRELKEFFGTKEREQKNGKFD